jgi:hypothetical protein
MADEDETLMEITMEGAEMEVKEFLEFVAEENLQHEQLWHEFCARFEAESFSKTMEAIGKRLAGKLRRALYDRGINIRADINKSSVDALCASFDSDEAPILAGSRSTPQQSRHGAGGAPNDPDEEDGDDDDDGRYSRRRPPVSRDDHSNRRSGSTGSVVKDEIHAQRQYLMLYSAKGSRFSGLAGDNFTQWSTTLGMNLEASHKSDVGALKVLHLTLSGVSQSHYQSSILPKLRAENMHVHSVLDHMSAYTLDKAMQTRAYKEFHTMSFCTFRRSPAWSEKSETEVLRAYVAELQSYQ